MSMSLWRSSVQGVAVVLVFIGARLDEPVTLYSDDVEFRGASEDGGVGGPIGGGVCPRPGDGMFGWAGGKFFKCRLIGAFTGSPKDDGPLSVGCPPSGAVFGGDPAAAMEFRDGSDGG